MELKGKRGTIKPCERLVVPELFGKIGTITKQKTEDISAWNAECKAFHRTPQPDPIFYWLQFDKPMTKGHHKGWKGVWIEEKFREEVLEIA